MRKNLGYVESLLEKARQWYRHERRQVFFLFALIITLVIAISLDIFIIKSNLKEHWFANIVVEFHGLIFDIILFGIVFTIFEKSYRKSQDIVRYKEELDDYRHWHDQSLSPRINGLITRLIRNGYHNIDLSYLKIENCRIEWKIVGPKLDLSIQLIRDDYEFGRGLINYCKELNIKKSESVSIDFQSISFLTCFFEFERAKSLSINNCYFRLGMMSIDYLFETDSLDGIITDSSFETFRFSINNNSKSGVIFTNCIFTDMVFPTELNDNSLFSSCHFRQCAGLDWLDGSGNYG